MSVSLRWFSHISGLSDPQFKGVSALLWSQEGLKKNCDGSCLSNLMVIKTKVGEMSLQGCLSPNDVCGGEKRKL